ncbi:MAG: alpha/beta hydrolase [Gammaproteobacteria bacterium]
MLKLNSVPVCILSCFFIAGCIPMTYPPGEKLKPPHLEDRTFLTEDGARLPLRRWLPESKTKAVIIALHGFNDYSRFFEQPGRYFSQQGIACYAYDQRGFGAAPKRGRWAGTDAYVDDLITLVRLLERRHPENPIYLLGESMGGAVIITAMSQKGMPGVAGMILAAPALWARKTMPWYQSGLLWALAHTIPWLTLTGESVEVTPSDNMEMLRALGRDPWVIKGTRVETLYGLANLMDAAYDSAESLRGNTLLLYGEKDEIIPKEPTFAFLKRFLMAHPDEKTIAFYQQGYHMLLRDLQGATIWQDIAAWIDAGPDSLPSGADKRARLLLSKSMGVEGDNGSAYP